ncbi:uncharacterized protein EDB91DRAFT_1252468 [Suillus paluster]|uniref:uncharacterized protein n=1 Tax=Suillus paluster TaxID=48578 RepID=UPI001B87BFCD|nr:uncharacterized protein EDB91DRAFT_1252468 [Suillus paluster]KAG1730835.1 hypothetical protein EDB91DRAFT_1252468 [Suillus paluster]
MQTNHDDDRPSGRNSTDQTLVSDVPSFVNGKISAVKISDIALRNLPTIGINPLDDRFSVHIIVGGQLQRTSTAGWLTSSWRQKYRFNIIESPTIVFDVFAHDLLHKPKRIGTFEDTFEALLRCPSPIGRTIKPYGTQDHKVWIEFKITPSSSFEWLRICNVDLQGLPRISRIHTDAFFVQFVVDDTTLETSPKKSKQGHYRWTNNYQLPYNNASQASLEIIAKRYLHSDEAIAALRCPLKQWLSAPGGVVRQTLRCPKGADIHVEFNISQVSGVPTAYNYREEDLSHTADEQNVLDITLNKRIDALDISAVILDLDRVPRFGKLSCDDRFFLELSVEDKGESQTIKSEGHQENRSFTWDTVFTLGVSQTSRFMFRVFGYDGKDRKEIVIGKTIFGSLDELLQPKGVVRRQLTSSATFLGTDAPTLSFRAARPGVTLAGSQLASPVRQEFSAAANRVADLIRQGNIKEHHSIIHDAITQAVGSVHGDVYLSPLLAKIGVFVTVAERLSSIHPYAKMAFTILTSAYEVIRSRANCDRGIRRVLHAMRETYDLITSVDALLRLQEREQILHDIAQQTVNCAYFIRDYVDNRSKLVQAITNSILNAETEIKQHEDAFKDLMHKFHLQLSINTHVTVSKVHEELHDHAAKAILRDMAYANDARCITACSATATSCATTPPPADVIASIQSWVNGESKDSERICVVYGPEKPCRAIAQLVGEHFRLASRLGSSYCFRNPRTSENRTYANLFSTIARDLADHHVQFKENLQLAVADNTSLRKTQDVKTQFEGFVLAPSRDVVLTGPLLVIIDGLELGGNEASRKDVLAVLAGKGSNLPRNLRFLITCRPEEDICKAFRRLPHIVRRQLGETSFTAKQEESNRFGAENHVLPNTLSPSPPSLAPASSPPPNLEDRQESTSSRSSSESSTSGLTSFTHDRAASPITSVESAGFDEEDALSKVCPRLSATSAM